MEFKDLMALVAKRRWVVLGVLLLSIAISAAIAFQQPARYEATATLALTPDVSKGQGFVASDNLSTLLGTYAATAKSSLNLLRAERRLGRELPADIDTSTEAGTGILRISATATDPRDAADAASATSQAFVDSIRGNQLLVATVVDPAAVPNSPIQPRPPLIIAVAALIGLFAGVLLAFALENFRRRIETTADVAEHTTAPVVGRLPRQRLLVRNDARIIWEEEGVVGLQEAYRALRTNLQFLTDSKSKVLTVTSPEPAQGKSTVVANLAVALAQVGVETIVVDADLRRPNQHEIFGIENELGLSTMMAMGQVEPRLVATAYADLWVLPSGPIPPDPTEMLHIRLPSVLAGLRELDTLVLVDTPPLLPVSDARLVAPQTDGVLLVVSAGSQKPANLEAAIERLRIVDGKLLGVVLNKAGQEFAVEHGYYYEYRPPTRNRREVEPA